MKNLFRKWLLTVCVLGLSAVVHGATQPPNIVVILADDLGYGDVSFNGTPDYTTPNIDSIAANGVLCTNGYVTHPVCSPSRAGLITGRYQQRFGYENNMDIDSANSRLGLPINEVLLPQILKPAGYVCGAVGKWHLGWAPNFHAVNRGFDEFFGFLGANSTYYNADVFRNETALKETAYLTDAFTREGVSFINRHATQPFFLYLAYSAVHGPYDQPPAKYVNRVANITNAKRRTYAAMVVAMDDGVGQVLQALQTNNLVNKTLIFFLSDNGAVEGGFTRNLPLRGFKLDMLEGGIRVPFAMQWTGRLPAHSVYDGMISSLDIVPTAAAAAGLSLPTDRVYDGWNVLPYLTGQQAAPQRALFWHWFGLGVDGPPGSMDTIWAVRNGPLKLVTERAKADRPPALYSLPNDIGETRDLASSQPANVASLQKQYDSWVAANVIPPVWQFNTDFPKSLVLAGDWNKFQIAGSTPAPWQLTWTSAPGVNGTPDAFNWFANTIHVASAGGDTTPGLHSFTLIGNNSYSTQWGGATINIDGATTIPFFSGSRLGPANSVTLQSGFYYSFRVTDPVIDNWNFQQVGAPLKLAVVKTSAPPVSLSRSKQTPTAPAPGDPVVVSIVTNRAKCPEERIYLRWSTDFFMTSNIVSATGSGLNYSATIPPRPAGAALQYCVITSTVNLSSLVSSGAIDALTLATTSTFTAPSTGTPPPTPTPSPTATPTATPSATPTPTPTGNTVRINCGGPAYTDTSSNSWSADIYFAGGTPMNFGSQAVSGTSDPTLYRTERYARTLAYNVPVANGTYTVTLDFAEMYFTGTGQRVFNVTLEGQTVLRDFDIFALAGAKAAVQRSFVVSVSDATLNIVGTASVNNAKFSAIEIVGNGGPTPTPTPTPTATPASTSTPNPSPTATAPAITRQPADKIVTEGQTSKFALTATGTGPLHYQWMKNGSNINGATRSSYATPAITMADSGTRFAATVSNSAGSVTSNDATLTVMPGP